VELELFLSLICFVTLLRCVLQMLSSSQMLISQELVAFDQETYFLLFLLKQMSP
jgi:hypothetical protein